MTRDEGHRLLNKLQEGAIFDYEQITEALVATGDLAGWRETNLVGSLAAGMRSEGLDQAIQTAHQGTGPTGSGQVVARNEGSNSENSWPGWSKYLDSGNE